MLTITVYDHSKHRKITFNQRRQRKIKTTGKCLTASLQDYRSHSLRLLESRSVAIKFTMFESEMPQVSDLGTGNGNLSGTRQFESLPPQKLRQKSPCSNATCALSRHNFWVSRSKRSECALKTTARFRAKMNSALAVSSAKRSAAKRQEVIFLPHIFLHRMPFLLESPVKAVVGVDS